MKKLMFLLITFTLFSCTSNEPKLTYCQENNIGYVKITNTSNDSYDVFLNDTYFKQQPAKTFTDSVKFKAGKSYTVRVKQVSGYIFTPTEKTYNLTINMCDYKAVTFP